MTDTPQTVLWQATVTKAVASMEQRTGLQLANLSPHEITKVVRRWVKAKQDGTLSDVFPTQEPSP